MFTPKQNKVIAKLLYVALSYNSREGRIKALLNNTDLEVQYAASLLKYQGYLKDDHIERDPQ